MSFNLRDELNKLSNTAPVLKDIDEYSDDETRAKVAEKTKEYEDELGFNNADLGNKRFRQSIGDLSEYDSKYKGKRINRKDLNFDDIDSEKNEDDSAEEMSDNDAFDVANEEENDDDKDEEDTDDEEDEEEDEDEEDNEYDDNDDGQNDTDEKKNLKPKKKSKEQEVLKLSNYNQKEEIEKGKAVKNQLNFWDNLVETRVRLQNVLNIVNQFPQHENFDEIFENLSTEFKSNHDAQIQQNQESLIKVMNQLIELQQRLVQRNPETNYILSDLKIESEKSEPNQSINGQDLKRKRVNSEGSSEKSENEDDEEIFSDTDEEMRAEEIKRAKKEKKIKTFHFNSMKPEQFEEYLAGFNKSFVKYRDSTIQKWYDKTRLTSGKSFESLEKPILQQIEHILLDKDRIIKRTQLKRGQYKICGKVEEIENEADLETLKNRHLKDYDPEIFDDQDFYNQLLRELIERKSNNISDPIELSRKSIELQKLRTKNKKKVDTKASKGRKIKFEIHKPLVNFMAPIYHNTMSEEARNELFRSLFGASQRQEKQNSKNNDIDYSRLFKGF